MTLLGKFMIPFVLAFAAMATYDGENVDMVQIGIDAQKPKKHHKRANHHQKDPAAGGCNAYTNQIVCPQSSCTWNTATSVCEDQAQASAAVQTTAAPASVSVVTAAPYYPPAGYFYWRRQQTGTEWRKYATNDTDVAMHETELPCKYVSGETISSYYETTAPGVAQTVTATHEKPDCTNHGTKYCFAYCSPTSDAAAKAAVSLGKAKKTGSSHTKKAKKTKKKAHNEKAIKEEAESLIARVMETSKDASKLKCVDYPCFVCANRCNTVAEKYALECCIKACTGYPC